MNKDQTKADSKSIFKEWLEKLQQESWQLELLISGFAIVGIYSARSLITDFYFFRENGIFGDLGMIIGLIGFIFKTGWMIFFVNLLIHVILRGLWIGAIGLRYVSEEIDYDSLGYSDIFTEFLKKNVGSYDDFIERLEKICSVLFAYTFLLFLLFTSLMVFILQTLTIIIIGAKSFDQNENAIFIFSWLGVIYFLLGSLVFMDLITLGGLKKINDKFVSKAYYHLYRYYSIVTFSFLYRPLLYNFIDNLYTRKLFYLSIPYIFIMIVGSTLFKNNSNPYLPENEILLSKGMLLDDYYYDDLRNIKLNEFPNEERKINKKKLKWTSLEKFRITESVSSVFFRIDEKFLELIEKDTTITPYEKKGINFKWFNLNKIEDQKISSTEKMKSNELMVLFVKKRALRKELKKYKNIKIQEQIDSISHLIDEKTEYWNLKITNERYNKVDRIMDSYTSNFKFFIDSIQVSLNQCYFYTHPHYEEQGLKCFFNLDSISNGLHHVRISRNFYESSDEIMKDSINLPIIKQ